MRSGFDSRARANRFEPKMRVSPPVAMKPGDALISSLGSDKEPGKYSEPFGGGSSEQSPILSMSILTCLEKPVPPDAFRPAYCDRQQKIYLSRDLKRELLPRLKYDKDGYDWPFLKKGIFAGKKTTTVEDWALLFERPWVDIVYFGFDSPCAYKPAYAHIIARVDSMVSLILSLDLPQARKEKSLIGFLQYGIDNWGAIRAGFLGWPAHGGHGSGRKWPIVLAGVLLGDDAMASPSKTYPKAMFGEDLQTMYGHTWTGAEVAFAGHLYSEWPSYWGPDKPKSEEKDSGPYEHKDPSTWNSWNNQSEGYRRCCNVSAWVGYALVIQLMHLEKQWDHDAFFDYCDRWMYEDNGKMAQKIKEGLAKNPDPFFHDAKFKFPDHWITGRQHAVEPFVQEMWDKYRPTLNKPTDGWEKPHTAGEPATRPASGG